MADNRSVVLLTAAATAVSVFSVGLSWDCICAVIFGVITAAALLFSELVYKLRELMSSVSDVYPREYAPVKFNIKPLCVLLAAALAADAAAVVMIF